MSSVIYYRGGSGLTPSPGEVKIDPRTSLLKPTHGVSVWDRPDGLERFGGAYQMTNLPAELRIIQRGRDPHHFEIVPAYPMSFADYEEALDKVILIPA